VVVVLAAAVIDSKVVQHRVLNNAASSLVSMRAKTVAVMCALSSALKPVDLKTVVTTASVAHLVKKVAALKVVGQKAVQKADLKVAATAVLPAAALATSLSVVQNPWALAASNPIHLAARPSAILAPKF
jgi:hypothetical protein